VTVVTVAGVSAGVAFAATTGPTGAGGNLGSLPAGAKALSGQAARYRTPPGQTGAPARRPVSRTASTPSRQAGAAARRAAAKRPFAAAARPAVPYEFYDSTDPQTVPAGAEIAVYATGGDPTPAAAVAGRQHVLWIDTLATDPQAQVLDIEPGCAQPSQAPQWVTSHLKQVPGSVAILYTMLSEWPQVQSAVASLPAPERSRIRWWIADPTGSPHIVPGSSATQWYWGPSYDISTALPDFQRATP
jgi:hypothetical protein